MSKYAKSEEALPANLQIWDTTPTQTAILESRVVDIHPTSSIDGSDVLSFNIPPYPKLMLERVEIVAYVTVRTADGGVVPEDANVSTVPHLAAALWRNVDVSIGGTSLTQAFDNSWTLSKFWGTLIHVADGATGVLWEKEGFLLDDIGSKAESESLIFHGDHIVNKTAALRAKRITLGESIGTITDIGVPLIGQSKLLPTNLDVRVSLTKNYDSFILMEAEAGTHKIVYDKVLLRCTFQRPTDMALSLIEERLANENAVYHADKSVLTFHPIPQGAKKDITISNVFNGVLPYCFLIGVQDRAALGQARHKNPFSLYPIHSAQAFIDGKEHFPTPVTRTNNEFGVMYDTFLRELGYPNNGDLLLYDHYRAYPAISFDLTPDKSQNQHCLNLVKSGTVRLSFDLATEAPQNLVLMVLAWYDRIVEIDSARQVTII